MIPLTARLHFHLLSSCEERKRKQKVASVREREAKENLSTLYLGRRHSFKKKNGDKPRAAFHIPPKEKKRERKATGLGDDTRTGVLPGVPGAQGAFEDWMARWFPRFASRIAFRCVLHPRESRDIRRRELFRGFSFRSFFFLLYCTLLFLLAKKKKVRYNKSLKHSFVSSEVKKDHKREKECVLSGVDKGWTPSQRERGGLPHFTSGSREVDRKINPSEIF